MSAHGQNADRNRRRGQCHREQEVRKFSWLHPRILEPPILLVPLFLSLPEFFLIFVEYLLSFLGFDSILFLFPKHLRKRSNYLFRRNREFMEGLDQLSDLAIVCTVCHTSTSPSKAQVQPLRRLVRL